MKTRLVLLVAILMLFVMQLRSGAASPLKLVRTIPMPGVAGRFDFFRIDVKGQRLFVTPLDHKSVEVYDLKAGKLLHSITGIAKAHAVLYRGDKDKIFVTDGPAGSIKIYKGKGYELVKTIEPLPEPDGILFDGTARTLHV